MKKSAFYFFCISLLISINALSQKINVATYNLRNENTYDTGNLWMQRLSGFMILTYLVFRKLCNISSKLYNHNCRVMHITESAEMMVKKRASMNPFFTRQINFNYWTAEIFGFLLRRIFHQRAGTLRVVTAFAVG